MSYGGFPYGGVGYAGSDVGEIPQADTEMALAVEVAFTTGALEEPAWVDIRGDVRAWDVSRGRNRELERFQPGRASVVLSNLERQYDSVNAAGPWFGNLKPMRRVRIRETFNGTTYPVFDGFVDKWQLDYPGGGKDATATVTATDAFKILARTDLPRSVYDDEVLDDAPKVFWRLEETKAAAKDSVLVALNAGTLGTAGNGAYVGPPELGGEALVVRDPATSIALVNSDGSANAKYMGVNLDITALDLTNGGTGSFAVECWCVPTRRNVSDFWLWDFADTEAFVVYLASEVFQFAVRGATSGQVTVNSASAPLFGRYHVVARYQNNVPLRLWVNGVLTTGGTPVGNVIHDDDFRLGHILSSPFWNWYGKISHVAVYTGTQAEAVDQAWVDTHYAAGTAPWQDDQPKTRADRILDLADWSATLRELDAGNVALQSAQLGTTALEHLQKIGETEFGLLFVTRDGKVRLVGRTAQATRTPSAFDYDDDTYRALVPDDGDEVVRNTATISRLQGVAQTSTAPASVEESGRFQYTLDGLLHRLDSYSLDYADFVVAEYADARRRIVSLALGPPESGAEPTLYPAMLGVELGDAVTVTDHPPGGGAPFVQVCVVEGIGHTDDAYGHRTTTLTLSPEFTEALF